MKLVEIVFDLLAVISKLGRILELFLLFGCVFEVVPLGTSMLRSKVGADPRWRADEGCQLFDEGLMSRFR